MSDLVKRLRMSCTPIECEAADEIERKDAAIDELLAALKSAKGMVVEWASYVEYANRKEKVDEDIEELDAAITKAEL